MIRYSAPRNFRTLKSFRKFAVKYGYSVGLVTKTKTNSYYQMYDQDGAIVGYFNTKLSRGAVR